MVRHRGSSLLFTLIALGVAIGSRPAHGQTISFLHPLSGVPLSGGVVVPLHGSAVAADASGVYVVGDLGFAKYDSHGNELWTRVAQVRGPMADGTGLYVVGRTYDPNFHGFVRRYDADGNELWTRQTETLFQSAGDASGLYAAGATSGETITTLIVRKYDASGAEQWTRPFGTPKPGVGINAMAVSATGLYVVGGDDSSTTMRKYATNGNELWSRQILASLGPGPHGVTAMTADNTGVYLVTPGPVYFLSKFDTSGNELWALPVGIPMAGARLNALTSDATGIYVAGSGFLPGQCRLGAGGDAFARKYDPDGAELWTREFQFTAYSSYSSAEGVAVDDTGVYVVGGEYTTQAADPTSFLAKFEKPAAVVTDSRPRILPDCVVNAASYFGGAVAPGEIVTIFGAAMGPADLVPLSLTADRRLDTTLAGARILFNGTPAPLLYVSDKQSSAIVPYAVADHSAVDVQVEYQGLQSDVVTVGVVPSRPGIFSVDGSGQGLLAIVNEDGSVNSPSNPAARGSIVSIYGTGGGERDPAVADGQILSDVLPRVSLPISVYFDKGDCSTWAYGEVLYAGGVPGSVAGLLQLNVRVPPDALTGKAVYFGLSIGNSRVPGSLAIALR